MTILTTPTFHGRAGLRAAAAATLAHVLQHWRARQADQALHGMSDEMLHDIGVARSEIEDVTRHGRPSRV